ncbi:MAG: DUF2062 domain-containing protein [Deltaproteobacteria bacterium]|nr:DUF2062 domain-containing protein [Deltaproteobacteria bacterium]
MVTEQDDSRKKSRNVITAFLLRAYRRFLKIRGNPHEIALGFALGLFVGMTPFMGFQTPIAVFFAAIFQWNKISSAAGVWISNPVTAPVLYGITYFVGAKMTGLTPSCNPAGSPEITVINLLQSTPEILMAMIFGGIIIGIPIAITGYFFSFSALKKYQDDIKIKLVKKKEKRTARKQQKKILKEKIYSD